MDRLIIESALSEVTEIYLSTQQGDVVASIRIVLRYNMTNADQVRNAFNGLKEIVGDKGIQLVICSTRVTRIFDLEIKSEELDEPIRIMNKSIDSDTLSSIEDSVDERKSIFLTTNVSEEDEFIKISEILIKACDEVA